MKYRDMGKTGDRVSIMGMGGGRYPEITIQGKSLPDQDQIDEMIGYAYRHGINYFDTAPLYCSGNCESAVGRAVKNFREKVFLAGKIKGEDVSEQRFFQALQNTLSRLGTDYLDYYFFWGIGKGFFNEKIVGNGILKQAYEAKEQGLIRHVAFSFHGMPEDIRFIIDTAEMLGYPFEAILVQYNFLDRMSETVLQYAAEKGIGTVVMGPAGGGMLISSLDSYKNINSDLRIPSYEFALRYVMENPNVNCALSGMQNMSMVRENVTIPDRCIIGDGSIRNSDLCGLGYLSKFNKLYCTGCKYCQPCPAGIRIQDIFKFYTYYNVYDLKEYAKNQYRDYIARGRKNYLDCLNCGNCEKRCPQHIKIREELKRVDGCLKN